MPRCKGTDTMPLHWPKMRKALMLGARVIVRHPCVQEKGLKSLWHQCKDVGRTSLHKHNSLALRVRRGDLGNYASGPTRVWIIQKWFHTHGKQTSLARDAVFNLTRLNLNRKPKKRVEKVQCPTRQRLAMGDIKVDVQMF